MGYETKFKIKLEHEKNIPSEVLINEFIGKLEMLSTYNFTKDTDFEYDLESEESYKWYDHGDHMMELSLLPEFKDVLFIVKGEGEESGDIWQAKYKNGNGRKVKGQVIFDWSGDDK